MSNGNPTNERKGIEACLANDGLRDVLLNHSTDADMVSAALDAIRPPLTFHNAREKQAVVAKIGEINWADMQILESLLREADGGVHPVSA